MKKQSIKIYAKLSKARQETIFSGITFIDFMESINSIENLLILKGNFVEEKSLNGFELLEGIEQIKALMHEDIYSYGDFCFVDYSESYTEIGLKKNSIAELLYLAHMFEPLNSPFFDDELRNKFVYLSHDDGWYCKLFCKEHKISVLIVMNKILKSVQKMLDKKSCLLPDDLGTEIYKLLLTGLLVEVRTSARSKFATIDLHDVGECDDVDAVLNSEVSPNQCISIKIDGQDERECMDT